MQNKKSPAELGSAKENKHSYGNSSASQRARILRHFEKFSSLSTLQARNEYGILHPGGRINELRQRGHKIMTYWVSEPDSNGVLHRVGLYIYQKK